MKTTIRKATIVCALAGVMAAGVAQGLDIRYRETGDWSLTAPLNTGPGWQNATNVPTTADMGVINWGGNTVTLTTTESIGELRVGQDEVGNFTVASGGNLTTVKGVKTGRLTLGQGNNPAGTGTMTVLSGGTVNVGDILYNGNKANGTADIYGTVNVGSHLWTGWSTGITGTYNIYDGGLLNVAGMLGLNWQNNGGIGLLNVNDGGTLNLAQIHASGNSIQGASLLTIAGSGVVYKTGNFQNVIQTLYVDTGKMVGAGGAPLSVSYDAGLDRTVVFIPEPSSFALMTFMGVGLLVRRLGRKS
jgi:hypothetical protein